MKNISTKSVIIILLVLFNQLLLITESYGQDPFIPKYDAVKRSERCFTVTWETNNQFGAVWWADKVDFSQDTAFNFVVYMGDRDGDGADGLAFVMHQDPRDTITNLGETVVIGGAGTWNLQAATGDDGGGLGFAMHNSRVGPNKIPGPHGPGDDPENHKIQNSVAVEMDTWNNEDVPDGRNGTDANGVAQPTSSYYGWDHTAVIYNGDLYGQQQIIADANGNTGRILPLKPSYAFGSNNNPDGSAFHNIEDDRCYMFQIKWITNPDGTQTLQLWADVYNGTTNTDGLQMIMTHTDDMINNVFGGNSIMRFGFTGSTGGSINEQTICLLGENLKPFAQNDYASIPLNSKTVIDVEANDNDPDGDQLHVPIIIDPARHGMAEIFDSLGTNYMRYTPNTNFVGLDTIGYVTCDVNSTKCYAKCDTAFVFIDVGCIPFDVDLTALSPNVVCSDSVPANGIASANVDATFLRGTVWYEGFEDTQAQQTEDTGPTPWISYKIGSNCSSGNNLYAQNFAFRTKVVTGTDCELVFETGDIDISTVSDACISIDFWTSNAEYESDDYIESYYILDGGPETMFDINGRLDGNFGIKTSSTCGLNGSTLKIVVRTKSNHSAEEYYWDNIRVTAVGAAAPDVSYFWYEGATPSGPSIFEGAINNSLSNGTYTVVAIDNLTGCPSNPATITIDSAGYQVPGGFIEQLSPFTNCQLPYDGALGAGVIDGTDTTTVGYTFEWYYQEDPKLPSFIQRTGAVAQNLESREYTVVITENSTGCDTTINAEVPNEVSLPVINVTKLADVTSCSDPNSGAAQADVGGVTNGYTFEWYVGPSIGSGPPNYTGNIVNTFPVGTFAVQAIDNTTLCPSDPATVTINDLTTTPDILVNVVSEQISCDPAAPTGELSGAVNNSGTPTTTGYTFNWYKGPNDINPARPGYSGGPVADSLEAGPYRLVVVEDGTNCTAFVDTLIQDMTVAIPDITISSTDVTSCAAPNGTITVTLDPSLNAADFEFEVYNGNGIYEDSLATISSSPLIENLEDGNYTVIAVDIVTACASNPVTTTINDATVDPDATITSQPQVSCDTGNLTGSLTASMGFGAIDEYTFAWFDNSGNPITSSSLNGEVISALDSGSYEVTITNKVTQCENTYFPTVSLAQVFPVETVSAVASTHCAPSGNGVLNGGVQGQSAPYTGYNFLWESATTGPLGTSAYTVNGLEPGDYTLRVQDDDTKCYSNIAPVIVYDSAVTPIPTLSLTDNTSCDINNPNGQIEVTGTNEGIPLNNYSYAWFDNSNNDPQTDVSGSGEIVNSLNAGTYRLEILNTITSCSDTTFAIINNVNIKPVIDNVNVTDATRCADPYMSGAEVTSIGGSTVLTDFTFRWINTDLGGTILLANSPSPIISDATDTDGFEMPPGNYSVIAYNSYGCPSDTVAFEVKDNSIDPTFTINSTPNSSCSWIPATQTGMSNGTLEVNYAGPNTILAYNWERESPSSPGTWTTFGGNAATVVGLHELDNYRVEITDDNGCSSTNYASIAKVTDPNPYIGIISVTDLTDCATPNGSLEAQVLIGNPPPAGYGYEFELSGTMASTQLNNGIFNNLQAGAYQVMVTNTFTECQSNVVDTVVNVITDLQFTITPTAPANCTGALGSILISSASNNPGTNEPPATGLGFGYNWFVGTDKSTSVNPIDISTPDLWSSQAANLTSGYFTIEITDMMTSCSTDTTVFLPSNSVPVFLAPSITNSTQCTPGNGQVELTIDVNTFGWLPSLAKADYSNYEYILFKGSTIDHSWSAPLTTEIAYISAGSVIGAPVKFTGLEPGIYTVVAKEDFPDYCFSDPKTFEIGLDYTFDPLSLIEVSPDNTCSTATGNGQLDETNNAFYTTGAEFEYTWYKGTDTSIPGNIVEGPTTATKITPDTLRAGLYTLHVKVDWPGSVDGLGCETEGVINLNKQLDVIRIDAAPVKPNDICAVPGNGEIYINSLSVNGSTLGNTTGYDNFTLLDKDNNDITASVSGTGTNGDSWVGLNVATYYVTARNTTTLCTTPPYQVNVNDISQDPVITIDVTSPDYSCIAGSGTGALEAFANGLQDVVEYDYNWYLGPLGGPNVSDIANPFEANYLEAKPTQLYTIEVEDLVGPNRACRSKKVITLTHQGTTIVANKSTIANQTICGPNGQIQVTEISEYDPFTGATTIVSQPTAYTGQYNAVLYESDLTTVSPASYGTFNDVTGDFGFSIPMGTFDTDVIPAGTYYVRAQNVVTGCEFGPPTQVIIKDVSRKPIISAILDNPDFACFATSPGNMGHTGQLTPTAIGGSDGDNVSTNFVISWTSALTGSAPPGGTTATNLWPDTYTLTVEDVNGPDRGCKFARDYIVPVARKQIEVFASGGDQTICNPDGLVQIDLIEVDGVAVPSPENLSWTGYLLDNNKNDLNAPETGFISTSDPYLNIKAGTYFVKVRDNSTLCYSNADPVIIHDASTDPVISMSVTNPQWSLNPNPLSWTGALNANVTEANGSGTLSDYNINWYKGIGKTNSINETVVSIDSLDQGTYTMTAQNINTGCESAYSIYLPYEYLEPVFLTLVTPKTICSPNNGAIEVTDIELDGSTDDLDDYTFEVYHDNYINGNTPDTNIPGNNSGTYYNNINTGKYYIIAHENWWWVESYPVKVEVLDSTTNPIISFDVTDYKPVTSCDQSVLANGALGVEIYEDPNNPYVQSGLHDYGYKWIDESTGQIIPDENTNTISGLKSGEYTVVVINLDNNCESQASFVIDDESTTPVVVANQSPNTNCEIEIANGIVDANVINSNNDYVFNWYEGTEITNTPAYQGQIWRGRPSGIYTIVAVDHELYTCISEPVAIEVDDATENPVVLINEVAPVTHCDPERPDGVLSAVTQDGVSGHTFEWYLNGELKSTGPIASELGLYDYELIVTNNVTLCKTSMIAGPSSLISIVPPPDVDILSDRTSCLNPDGQAIATIEGNVVDHIFRFYNKYSGEELSNLYRDYVIHDLDTSTYLVTAESRETGCVSEPTEFAIENATYFPEIDVIVTPSNCMEPSGEANVIISDMTRNFSVTWIGDNGFEAQEKELVFIPIGKYQVIVEGTDGCTTEAVADVKGDVIIYNAVSANLDGLNEYFQILCMEYFLNNNVKIYNRAGLLVYEQNYYDPTDPSRRFEGFSNKGASIVGTELPVGTYFYVVDKNDGSKPKVGYLELNR